MEHAVELPTRFRSESAPTDGSITITDKKTGRATTVGLTYYGMVAKSLNDLFDADTVVAKAPAAATSDVVSSPDPSAKESASSDPETAPETKQPTSRKRTSAAKKAAPQAKPADNAPNEGKAATKAEAPKSAAAAVKTPKKTATKPSKPKAAPAAGSTAEVIEGKGFKLMPRAGSDVLTYDIIADSGDNLGTVWQHQDTGRFHVDPNNTEKFGPTDHTSLLAAKARVFVVSR